jgi:hypothetical protein
MKFSRLITIIIIIIGVVSIIVVISLVKEGNKCLKDPFIYGANKLDSMGYMAVCTCQINQDIFIFDKNGFYTQQRQKINYFINLTD